MLKALTKAEKKLLPVDAVVLLSILLLLFLTPINTDISIYHMTWMGITLGLAVFIPYLLYRNSNKAHILFRFRLKSGWTWRKIAYIGLGIFISYLLFPFYFATTDAGANWPTVHNAGELILLFIGTNVLGIWDELFFINTLLQIFRRYFKFWYANVLQAVFWTIFLYELGFTGWAPLAIFPFALIQGYTYTKYKSLAFILAIHLSVDFMLFLAILDRHDSLPFKIFLPF